MHRSRREFTCVSRRRACAARSDADGTFKSGVDILVKELNVPVVPVKLDGLYELKRRRQYFAARGMVRVIFGEQVTFELDTKPSEIAHELQKRVAQLG